MYDRDKEIREAIVAGERALNALDDCEMYLRKAGGWGLWDMFGGDWVVGLIKHSKMNKAQESLERAERELSNFSRELRDVQMRGGHSINLSGFTKVLDIFCDGFLVDLYVQTKISDAKKKVAEAKRNVNDVLRELRRM